MTFDCGSCEQSFSQKYNLVKHQASVHGDRVECPHCSTALRASSLRGHIKAMHQGIKKRAKVCPVCEKEVVMLRKHMDTVHAGVKVVCPECGLRVSHLQSHLKTHSDVRPFVCDMCDFRAKRKNSLVLHRQKVHLKLRYYCQAEGCDKSYADPTGALYHLKKNHPALHADGAPNIAHFECAEEGSRKRQRTD